ncbi:MAG TPA: ABC transporter ATP-binding protein [Chitinophagaceae bacterium]|nr:ABC transporter ATP-binding protein [Chitinophagaceae bacterium]
MKKRLTRAKTNLRSSNEKSFQHLHEALKGYVEGNVFGKNSFFSARFLKQRQTFSYSLFETMILQGLPGRVIEVFAVLGLFILIALAHWTGNNDSAALLTIGAFMAAAYKIIPGIVKLINVGGQLRAYEHALPDFQNRGQQINGSRSSDEQIRSIEFRNVNFKYSGEPVLKNFSMSVKAGDFLGITGASGKGKTTILNLLLGLLSPAQGEININAHQKSQDDLKMYWPGISYVKQQVFFIHDTIQRNILLDEGMADQERWNQAISFSGVDQLLSHFPEGAEKWITENGKNLSGGQQQRIAFARAMYRNANCILLDEPFNELDESSENIILEKLQTLAAGGKIVILITHDRRSLSYCNKKISLDES